MAEGNFAFLTGQEPQLALLGSLAEKYWLDDANTALMKTRQFAELLAQNVAARTGLLLVPGEGQLQLLERLTREAVVPPDAARLFHEIRKSGNRANHSLQGDRAEALAQLHAAWVLGLWYMRTFFDPAFPLGEFVEPVPPVGASELRRLLTGAEDEVRRSAEQVAQLLAARQAQGTSDLNAGELERIVSSKNDLFTQADADADRFPNVVIRLGTDAPIQVPASSQTSVSGSSGTLVTTNLGFSTPFAQSMISGLTANRKMVVRVTRTTGGQPLTFMFPAAGFSTAWNKINQCRSSGSTGTAGSGASASSPAVSSPASAGATTTGGAAGAPKFARWAFTGCAAQGRTTSFLIAGQGSACGLNIDFIPNGASAIGAEFRYELEYIENGSKGKLVLDGVDRWSVDGGGNVQAQLFSNRLAFQVPLNVRLRSQRRYTSINVIASVVFDNGSSKRIYEPLPITQP